MRSFDTIEFIIFRKDRPGCQDSRCTVDQGAARRDLNDASNPYQATDLTHRCQTRSFRLRK
jgi:hypothetical protein